MLACDWLAGPLFISDIRGGTPAAKAEWGEGLPQQDWQAGGRGQGAGGGGGGGCQAERQP